MNQRRSTIRRNDRHDTDPVEAKLISIGHHIIRLSRRESANLSERTLFWEAAQLVWDAKREYRKELKVRRVQRAALVTARFCGNGGI
jgi:hypothetical protein